MARPKNFDENQVLEGAVALFKERGFEGTSMPDLTRELGICRQSLYSTFGDKKGLYVKALENYGQQEMAGKLALLQGPGSPLENLRTLIRGFASLATMCPSEGCLTVTALVETRNDARALAVVCQHVQSLESSIEDALGRAKNLGEIKECSDAASLARFITTSLYGIGLLVRLTDSSARIAATVAHLLETLEQYEV